MAKTSIGQEVGQEGSLREGLEAAIRERVREMIEMVLEEEVEAALGARAQPAGGRAERVPARTEKPTEADAAHGHGSRWECRGRGWWTPKAASASGRASWCRVTGGAAPEVEQSVLGVYLSGSNTRRIRGALEPLLSGAALSKSAVSRSGAAPGRKLSQLAAARSGRREDRVSVPGCDLSEGAQWRESGVAGGAGGAGGEETLARRCC